LQRRTALSYGTKYIWYNVDYNPSCKCSQLHTSTIKDGNANSTTTIGVRNK